MGAAGARLSVDVTAREACATAGAGDPTSRCRPSSTSWPKRRIGTAVPWTVPHRADLESPAGAGVPPPRIESARCPNLRVRASRAVPNDTSSPDLIVITNSPSASSACAEAFSEQSEPEERCVSSFPQICPYAHEVVSHRNP